MLSQILKSLRPTNSVEYRDSKSTLSMSKWRDLYLAALLDLSRAFTVGENQNYCDISFLIFKSMMIFNVSVVF